MEEFKCKLLQTYSCAHNGFTPAIQMAFQGTLYITDMHTCFSVEERNRKVRAWAKGEGALGSMESRTRRAEDRVWAIV